MLTPRLYPTIKLGEPLVTRDKILNLIAPRFGLGGVKETYPIPGSTDIFILEKGSLRIDADLALGRLWFASRDYLWKARQVPDPNLLPDRMACFELARDLLDELKLMPLLIETPPGTRPAVVRPSLQWIDCTRVASWRVKGCERIPEEPAILDRHVCFALFVEVEVELKRLRIPVLGFGGKAGVSFGENGEVIALNCAWRQPELVEPFEAELEPPSPTLKPPDLAYRIRDRGMSDLALFPVWTYEDPRGVDGGIRKSLEAPAIVGLFPGPWLPAPTPVPPPALPQGAPGTRPKVAAALGKAGIAWFDDPELRHTVTNVTDFKSTMIRGGWDVPFMSTGTAGSHKDWIGTSPAVEGVEMMFYAGHADEAGWKAPDNKVRFDQGAQWGKNLEWIAISACGPLQDRSIRGGVLDAFNWNRVFNGLRSLLGYATTIADSPEDGAFFATHAQLGLTIHEAWFRMARDVQCRYDPEADIFFDATVFAAALYPEYSTGSGNADPPKDHLRGFGVVTPKPKGDPDCFVAVLVPV